MTRGSHFKPSYRSGVAQVGSQRLRVVWTNAGIAAVGQERLTTRRALQRRLRGSLVDAPVPAVLRSLLRLAAKGRAEEVPVDLSWAGDFERDVLEAARRIPLGETRPYRWLAREARRPLAIRAAASIMARNPLWLVVPCHRVIHSDGTIGSYGGGWAGLARKRMLLEKEGVHLERCSRPVKKRSQKKARMSG